LAKFDWSKYQVVDNASSNAPAKFDWSKYQVVNDNYHPLRDDAVQLGKAALAIPADIASGVAKGVYDLGSLVPGFSKVVPKPADLNQSLGLPENIVDKGIQGVSSYAPALVGGEALEGGNAALNLVKNAGVDATYGASQDPNNRLKGAAFGLGANAVGASLPGIISAAGKYISPVEKIAAASRAKTALGNKANPHLRTPEEVAQLKKDMGNVPISLGQATNSKGMRSVENTVSMIPGSGMYNTDQDAINQLNDATKNAVDYLSHGAQSGNELTQNVQAALNKLHDDQKQVMENGYKPVNELADKLGLTINERPNLQATVDKYINQNKKDYMLGLQKERPVVNGAERARLRNNAYNPIGEISKNNNLDLLKSIQDEISTPIPQLNRAIATLSRQKTNALNSMPLNASHLDFLNALQNEAGGESPTLNAAISKIEADPEGKKIISPTFSQMRELESDYKNTARRYGSGINPDYQKQAMYNELAHATRKDYENAANNAGFAGFKDLLENANSNAKSQYYDLFDHRSVKKALSGKLNPKQLYNSLVNSPQGLKVASMLPQNIKHNLYLMGMNGIKEGDSGITISPKRLINQLDSEAVKDSAIKNALLDNEAKSRVNTLSNIYDATEAARVRNIDTPTGKQGLPYQKAMAQGGAAAGAIAGGKLLGLPLPYAAAAIPGGIGLGRVVANKLKDPAIIDKYINAGKESAKKAFVRGANKKGARAVIVPAAQDEEKLT
jgi:hypothetical protein